MGLIVEAWREVKAHGGQAAVAGFAFFVAMLAMIAISLQGSIADAAVVARLERDNGVAPTVRALVSVNDADLGRQEPLFAALDHRVGAERRGSWLAESRHANDLRVTTIRDGPRRPWPPDRSTVFIAGDLAGVRRTVLVAGRLDTADPAPFPGIAVVNVAGSRLAGLGAEVAIDGDQYLGGPKVFRVTAVIDDGGDGPTIYPQLSTLIASEPLLRENVEYFVHGPESGPNALAAALTQAAADGGIDLSQVPDRVDGVDSVQYSRTISHRAFVVVSLVALLVAAVGSAGIGMASVRERSIEFAIRRACGWSRRDVAAVVLLGNVWVALGGSALATAVCLLVQRVVLDLVVTDPLLGHPAFPWWAAVAAAAAGVAAAVVGGLAPGLAAARTDLSVLVR